MTGPLNVAGGTRSGGSDKCEEVLEAVQLVKNDTEEIKSSMTAASVDISTIKSDVSLIKAIVQSMQTVLNSAKSVIDAIKKKVDSIHNDTTDIKSDTSVIINDTTQLKTDTNTLKNNATTIINNVNTAITTASEARTAAEAAQKSADEAKAAAEEVLANTVFAHTYVGARRTEGTKSETTEREWEILKATGSGKVSVSFFNDSISGEYCMLASYLVSIDGGPLMGRDVVATSSSSTGGRNSYSKLVPIDELLVFQFYKSIEFRLRNGGGMTYMLQTAGEVEGF